MNLPFPFVAREKEIGQLQQLHQQGHHVLLLGAEGVGKSALVDYLMESLGLWVCPHSEHLSEICEALELKLDLTAGDSHLTERKNRILRTLRESKDLTVVFDGVIWTTPKLSMFIENVSSCVPVWLCARSEHPWDIGRVWPLLVRFQHVELKPFHPRETKKLLEIAVQEKLVPEETLTIVEWLHHRAAGNPKLLCALLTEIAQGHYDLGNPHALRLLDLDRRIHEIFPVKTDIEKM
jgi:hypothetical protein